MLELGSVARFGPEGLLVFVEDMEELPPHCDLIFASERSLISAPSAAAPTHAPVCNDLIVPPRTSADGRVLPRLAVLIPVFNDQAGLQKSLKSLAADGDAVRRLCGG